VDLHGGAVTAESDGRGKGSRFTVTLPSRPAADSAGKGSEHRGAQADRMLHGVRVLGVDDDEDARELILHAGRAAGADVMVVGSTPAALEALVTFRPDVIVVDIAMPGLDGYSLAREMGRGQPPHPPIVGLSAYAGPNNERQALESGFARYLGKPTDIATLVATIAAVVNKIKS
jgi:CheY-like chemotaxis protein